MIGFGWTIANHRRVTPLGGLSRSEIMSLGASRGYVLANHRRVTRPEGVPRESRAGEEGGAGPVER